MSFLIIICRDLTKDGGEMGMKYAKCSCKYRESFNNGHTPMLIIDPNTGDINDVNFAACDYYGYSRNELLAMNIQDINTLTEEEVFLEMKKAKEENRKWFRFKHILKDGKTRNVEVYSGPIEFENRELLFSVVHDINEKSELEEDYLLKKSHFENLFNNSPEAIAIVDENYRIVNTNKHFGELFQYNFEEVKNRDITKLLCEEIIYDTSYYFRECIKNGIFVKEEGRRRKKDGSLVEVLILAYPMVIDKKTIGAYCIYSDISQMKEIRKKIEILTSNDPLTGLFNKEFFMKNIGYEILKAKESKENDDKFGVIILSVNEFKEIKNALGYKIGDLVLEEFGKRLKFNINSQDIAARIGEDEFAILIPKIKELEQLRTIIKGVIDSLSTSFSVNNNEFKITTSIGIAIYPNDGEDSLSLIRKADIAMSKSKREAINRTTIFENSLEEEVQDLFWMKYNLTTAIENKEFFLNYQPILDTNINKLVGVEALLRWEHKDIGIIPPSIFIPVAEKTGMIYAIGEWALLNACKQNKTWQELGYSPIYISVNISALELERSDFAIKVKKILKESRLESKYLQLEITETFFTQNYKSIERTIKEISDLGIRISIDDFGTGYSSLEKLCELDINNLKIDKMFIDGVDRNDNKSKIVKAVISLAESLDIDLIAEGVETEGQLNFLKENRCNMAQGYLFSKPVSQIELEKFLLKD